jgi:hypothetical protein
MIAPMKRKIIIFALCCAALPSFAQTSPAVGASSPVAVPAPTSFAVVERGGNHRVWERLVYEISPSGRIVAKPHRYTELATGMYFKRDGRGEWLETTEQIQLLSDGSAAAVNGPHQVYFPADLYQGAIRVVTPDGKTLRSRPMGIAYSDGVTNVLIAELKSSVGQILTTKNQILYPDAFTDITCDIVATYRKSGFECDLVFRQRPPSPADYGLDPAKTRIQLLTEFFDAPAPTPKAAFANRADRLSDRVIDFGALKIGPGKAFSVGTQLPSTGKGRPEIPVYKTWEKLEGRTFLIEQVPYQRLKPRLDELASFARPGKHLAAAGGIRLPSRLPTPAGPARAGANTVRLAKADLSRVPGVVLDYVALTSDVEDYTFQSDTTYLVTGGVNIYGIATFEGGTVIKYDYDPSSILQLWGDIVCKTGPYRPAILTARNDDTVGEGLSEAGLPLEYFQAIACAGITTPFSYLHFRYSQYALHGYNPTLSDCQFINCQYPTTTDWGTCNATNILIVNAQDAFNGTEYAAAGYQVTVDGCDQLTSDFYGATDSTLLLVNSLVVNSGGTGDATLTTVSVAQPDPSEQVFQIVGSGSHYLATNSPYRDVGTTDIDPGLLARLAKKTTYPPIAYSNATLSALMPLVPQAQRDTDVPDLGYHYDPLDYAFGGTYVTSNLTFAPGTAVAWFRPPDIDHGIRLADQQILTFDGRVDAPNYFVRYNMVQEDCNGTWAGGWGPGGIIGTADQYLEEVSLSPEIHARFTRWVVPPSEAFFRDDWGYLIVRARDCEFTGGGAGGYGTSLYFTNCLFERTGTGIGEGWPGNEMSYQNCTFYGGSLDLTPWKTALPTSVSNCAFDGTIIDVNAADLINPGFDYNAFTNGMTRFPTGGAHDVNVGDSFNWQASWLGNYYLPYGSNLKDANTLITANQVGLYHYTTQVDQTKEGTSPLDIGYHYIAVNANGNPIDTDGDGVPDYLEDANGNGLVDSGETNWQDANDLGLKVIITRPKNNSILP